MTSRNQISQFKNVVFTCSLLICILFCAFAVPEGVQAKDNSGLAASIILSDGEFVYGPNVGDFSLKSYLSTNAPHLLIYADDLYGRSEYFSINPKIYLTLLEIHSQLISNPNTEKMEDAFGLGAGHFISQVEYLSNKMTEAYYLHLYSYSPLSVSQRSLESFVTSDGYTVSVASGTNAGTYAIIAGLAAMNEKNISLILDNSQANGFYQTYARLFGNNSPLDEKNLVSLSAEAGMSAAPDNLLQLPYLQGTSWRFGGVHDNSGCITNTNCTFRDASSLDFYPGGLSWGSDTSNTWIVASAAGIPIQVSACYFKILHADGWETTYYHLENIQSFSGSIKQNDKIGVVANTPAEATCSGGASSVPHVHFTLKHNGALVAINGTPLSGWYVHSGRWSYDTDPGYMWLEKAGVKKDINNNLLLSEALPASPIITNYATGVFRPTNGALYLKNSNTDGFANVVINYGLGGDYPIVGDWDGNGTDTIGVYRNGTFYLRNSNTLGFADIVLSFGQAGDQPIAGDWDGDGVDTIGVYHNGQFMLRNSNSTGDADTTFLLGNPGDVGIVGDWNGDGLDTTGVFRPNNGVIFLKNANVSGFADVALNYGLKGDQPVTGDWNNDGIDTIGVYRNGVFMLRNSNTIGFADLVFALGNPGDMPISGNWVGIQ